MTSRRSLRSCEPTVGSWWPVAIAPPEHPGWSFGKWEKEQATAWKTTLVARCRFGWVGPDYHDDYSDAHSPDYVAQGRQPFQLEITRTLRSLLDKPYQYTGKRQSRRRPPSVVFAAYVHARYASSQGNVLSMVGTCGSWEDACMMVGSVDPRHHLARLGRVRYARERWSEIRPCLVNRSYEPDKIAPPRVQPLGDDGAAFSTMDLENSWRAIANHYDANAAHVTPGDGRPPFLIRGHASPGAMSFAAWLGRMLVSVPDHESEPY